MKTHRKLLNNALAMVCCTVVALNGKMDNDFALIMGAVIVSFNWANTREYATND